MPVEAVLAMHYMFNISTREVCTLDHLVNMSSSTLSAVCAVYIRYHSVQRFASKTNI